MHLSEDNCLHTSCHRVLVQQLSRRRIAQYEKEHRVLLRRALLGTYSYILATTAATVRAVECLSLCLKHTHKDAMKQRRACTTPPTPADTNTHTHTYPQTQTHTHTHTYTRLLSQYLCRDASLLVQLERAQDAHSNKPHSMSTPNPQSPLL